MKRLPSLFALVAAASLFAMMVLTFADVFSRKFLGNSITGAVELTELFMLVMIFFALPLASLASEHIVFDLLDRLLPAAVLQWQQTLAHAVTALAFGGGAWVVWDRAQRTAEFGDTTSSLEIRLAPFHYLVAVMLVLTALVHAWLAWRAGRPDDAAA
jgi:TRAP-type C4-dicarboxylate transport system permease small subunit